MKKVLTIILRIVISAGLLIYLAHQIKFSGGTPNEPDFFDLLQNIRWAWFLPAFVLLGGQVWLLAWRWRIMLHGQGLELPYWPAFRLTYLGVFFNSFLLGAIGGDVVKAVVASRDNQFKTRTVISIVVDRLTGVGVLFLMCLLGALVLPSTKPEIQGLKAAIYGMAGLVIITLLLFIIIFYGPIGRRIKIFHQGVIKEIRDSLAHYRLRIATILKAAGLALVIHLITIVVNIIYAHALGIPSIPIWYFFIIIPIVDFVTSIPISVGGWGVGEISYGFLFNLWGLPLTSAIALSVLYRLTLTLWSLPGIWFVVHPPKHPPTLTEPLPQTKIS